MTNAHFTPDGKLTDEGRKAAELSREPQHTQFNYETRITKKLYNSKEIKQRSFSSQVLVNYYVETLGYHGAIPIINKYEVTCTVEGFDAGFAELCVSRVKALTGNEDTLMADALADLCGWECGAYVKTEMTELSDEETTPTPKAKGQPL